jgi:hypothetical protein
MALVEEPEGRRALGNPRLRLEDNIKMNFRVVGCWAWTGSICLMIVQVVGSCECGNEPSVSILTS